MFRHGTLRILAWSSREMSTHRTQWCFGVSTRGPFPRSTSPSSCWRRATPSTGTVRRHVSPSCTSWTSTSNVFICVIANRCAGSPQRKGRHDVKPRRALYSCGEGVCRLCAWKCDGVNRFHRPIQLFLCCQMSCMERLPHSGVSFAFVIWGSWVDSRTPSILARALLKAVSSTQKTGFEAICWDCSFLMLASVLCGFLSKHVEN